MDGGETERSWSRREQRVNYLRKAGNAEVQRRPTTHEEGCLVSKDVPNVNGCLCVLTASIVANDHDYLLLMLSFI